MATYILGWVGFKSKQNQKNENVTQYLPSIKQKVSLSYLNYKSTSIMHISVFALNV